MNLKPEYFFFGLVTLLYVFLVCRDQRKKYKGPYFSATGTVQTLWLTVAYLLFALIFNLLLFCK